MFDFVNLFAWCDLHASRITNSWTSTIRYFDRAGFPIPDGNYGDACLEWARLHADHAYRIIVQDDLPDGGMLSTVWLGLDHGYMGPPMIFETMRFSGDEEPIEMMPGRTVHPSMPFTDPRDGEETEQLRYTSEEEARAVHHGILRLLRLRLGH